MWKLVILRTAGFVMSGYWLGYALSLLTRDFEPARSTVTFMAFALALIVFIASYRLGGARLAGRQPRGDT